MSSYACLLVSLFFWVLLLPKQRFSRLQAFLLTLAACVVWTGGNLFLSTRYDLALSLSVVYYLLVTGWIYRDPLLRRATAILLQMVLLMTTEATLAAVTMLQYHLTVHEAMQAPAVTTVLLPHYLLFLTLFFGLPTLLAKKRPPGSYILPAGQAVTLPLLQAVILGGILYALYTSQRPLTATDAVVVTAAIAACVATSLLFLHIVKTLTEQQQWKQQQDLQARYYTALIEQQQHIRALRHDIGNHLTTAAMLAREGGSQAEEYLKNLTEQFHAMTAIDTCQNRVADAVLYSKASQAAAAGIPFSVEASLPEHLKIQDTDLMSLLSNLLDNALEATAQAAEPAVEVSIREKAGSILIYVRNTFAPDLSPDLRRTTKADKLRHGIGHQIVENICRKYSGSFSHTVTGTTFEATAMVLDLAPKETRLR
ncbi:MAG TPA: ATP-binding protein [Candidatus Evtepia faecigallinarum]|nr:ATP-binding protein [Candidatus Evtepia faecigallinarum]